MIFYADYLPLQIVDEIFRGDVETRLFEKRIVFQASRTREYSLGILISGKIFAPGKFTMSFIDVN